LKPSGLGDVPNAMPPTSPANVWLRFQPLLLCWLLIALALGGCQRAERASVSTAATESVHPKPAPPTAPEEARADAKPSDSELGQRLTPATRETAILAGGCFWGMQEILRAIPGVLETEAGYTGGTTRSPSYEDVHDGSTGHAEAVRVVFDPSKLTYADLLEKWFFRMHDPTTKDRQGNDVGSQYRSAIFTTTAAQRKTAEAVKAKVNASGKWKAPLATQIQDAGAFTRAEEYHQDYLQKNPGGYTCHYLRD